MRRHFPWAVITHPMIQARTMINQFVMIFNPTAGQGSAADKLNVITRFLEMHSIQYAVKCTEYPGHAVELAHSLISSGRHRDTAILAAGGDGTCNEVINGIMRALEDSPDKEGKLPMMGIIPIGRGNDFGFGAGLPSDLQESLELLIDPHLRSIDIGLVIGGDYPEGRFFGNGIGVGFDTIVGLEAAKMRHIKGAAGYTLGAIKTLIAYPRAPQLEISYNQTTFSSEPALVSIMNGRRMGGAFYMAPEGIMDDGLFNICMTRQGTRLQLLRAMLHYSRGTQAALEDTDTGMAPHFHLKALSGTMAVHADGETICEAGTELTVSCRTNVIQLITRSVQP